jgi:UDP-2,3-diacylglucosamine hydrolase
MTAAPPLASHPFEAPAAWSAIEFVSDVHLHAGAPRTFEAWRARMLASTADAIFILGDLFEVWIGDDARDDAFELACVEVLRTAAAARWVGFMAGNRDFLLGAATLRRYGVTALPDATVLHAFGRRVVLTHGDALCLADTDYLRFRATVRDARWQADFLGRPLAERRQLARAMRDASVAHQAGRAPALWADVDAAAALHLLQACGADVMVHGHTHRPGCVALSPSAARHVLSDWDFDGPAPRGGVLRLSAAGLEVLAAAAPATGP